MRATRLVSLLLVLQLRGQLTATELAAHFEVSVRTIHRDLEALGAAGVPVEAIALLAGHNQTATTELIYRHQIVPALTRGAEVMDQIFGS